MEEISITRPEEETLRALLRRADALNTACLVIELEEWANVEAKPETLAVLEEMAVDAHEWFVSYRRALGYASGGPKSERRKIWSGTR